MNKLASNIGYIVPKDWPLVRLAYNHTRHTENGPVCCLSGFFSAIVLIHVLFAEIILETGGGCSADTLPPVNSTRRSRCSTGTGQQSQPMLVLQPTKIFDKGASNKWIND
jgi:hypothetical protein